MTSRFQDINELLGYFDNFQADVDSKKSVVKDFLETLKWKFDKRSNFILNGSKFYKVGSSYENSVVNPNANFDVAMVLPSPITMEYFEAVETDTVGFYKLRCTDDQEYFEELVNGNRFLKVTELRDEIFTELISVMETIALDGYAIQVQKMSSKVRISLKKGLTKAINIDIVPYIGANVDDVPGWFEDNISQLMRDVIDLHVVNMLFSLSCPPDLHNENYSHLIVEPVFSLIEKECILKSDIVRDAVCIAKAVCKHHNWIQKGLHNFHIKRIALSVFDTIEKTDDAWDGYKIIMKDLIDMLKDGGINGLYIEDQILTPQDEDECYDLSTKMRKVVNQIQPNNILNRLGYL